VSSVELGNSGPLVISEVAREATTLAITGMSCVKGCANKIQRNLQALEGVTEATVDFTNATACVCGDVSPADLIACVEGAGPLGKFKAFVDK
jgi:Cu+-exporting ATPase